MARKFKIIQMMSMCTHLLTLRGWVIVNYFFSRNSFERTIVVTRRIEQNWPQESSALNCDSIVKKCVITHWRHKTLIHPMNLREPKIIPLFIYTSKKVQLNSRPTQSSREGKKFSAPNSKSFKWCRETVYVYTSIYIRWPGDRGFNFWWHKIAFWEKKCNYSEDGICQKWSQRKSSAINIDSILKKYNNPPAT